jgi:hypothetical protein
VQQFFFEAIANLNREVNGEADRKPEADKSNKYGNKGPKPFQWETSIEAVMNTFNLTWNETLKLNYRTFTHRCNYVKHKNEEALKAIKKPKK